MIYLVLIHADYNAETFEFNSLAECFAAIQTDSVFDTDVIQYTIMLEEEN